jgi:dipeptidyl aminopeptidase/acylaminoacyl peptidase
MRSRRSLQTTFLLAAFLLLPAPSRADGNGGVTLDDVLKYHTARQIRISPDGRTVAWTQWRPDAEKNRYVGDIWIAPLEGEGNPIHLTRGSSSDYLPRWSPDGRWIYFLSNRSEKTQVWKIPTFGGEAEEVTSWKPGISSFVVAGDGTLYLRAEEPPTLREEELEEKKDDGQVVEDAAHFEPMRVFRLEPEGKDMVRVTDNDDRVGEFEVSPDGRWLVTRHTTNPWEEVDYREKPVYFLWDLEGRGSREIWTDPRFDPSSLGWSPDSRWIYGITVRTSHPERESYVGVQELQRYDLETGKTTRLELDHDWGLGETFRGESYVPTREGVVVALAAGARNEWAVLQGFGEKPARKAIHHGEEGNIQALWLSPDEKTVVLNLSDASLPPQLYATAWRGGRIGKARRITSLNSHLEKKRLARSEVARWTSSKDGHQIEGILFYPLDYQEGKRYPLVVAIHGGPTSVDLDMFNLSWSEYPHVLAGRGCFVLMPNYRGGTNYGLEFVEAIVDHYYEFEVPDILSGVDALVDQGKVDPERMAVMGWSNGAILTISITVQTDRFVAASPGAGDVNWTSDFGNCAFGPHFDRIYFQGEEPWSRPDVYVDKSPLFDAEHVVTPTLLFHGENDTSVPTGQSWEYYRALQQIGKAPVRFILFPDEKHGLRRLSHMRRKLEEEMAWWNRYLFREEEPDREALQTDSPLDLALERSDWRATDEGILGERMGGVLVPEISAKGNAEADTLFGRFEVTRAQFAQYLKATSRTAPEGLLGWQDGEGRFRPGTENFPVSGVSFESAREYCRWLAATTGRPYRLPTTGELDRLLSESRAAAARENNLCYWAGYSPNPEDARRLEGELEKLSGDELLLFEVGRFPPSLRDLYDLQGNVAEWSVGKDGAGMLRGLCSRDPCDRAARTDAPESRVFHGFRVVLDPRTD